MSLDNSVITSLDIGSNKICCMVVSRENTGTYKVKGLGHNISNGIQGGTITDMSSAENSIFKAITSAEKEAGIKINGVVVSISNSTVESRFLKIEVEIEEEEISQKDIDNAFALSSKHCDIQDRIIIHSLPISYSIDGSIGIRNPIGMFGKKLVVELNIVSIQESILKTIIKAVTNCDIDVYKIVSSSYAAGLSTLKEDEASLGAVLIDMGSHTTSLGVFVEEKFVFTKTFPKGGEDITLGIARSLSISREEAEKLKIMHGSALVGSEDSQVLLELPNFTDRENPEPFQITRSDLVKVSRPIVEDVFYLIKKILDDSGYAEMLGRMVILTGGASQLDGMAIVASDILGYKVRIGYPSNIRSSSHDINNTNFSVSCGLIEQVINKKENIKSFESTSNSFKNFKISKFKNWIEENFL